MIKRKVITDLSPLSRGSHFQDITGQIFNDLTVIGYVGIERKRAVWLCRCSCGALVNVATADLRRNNTKSCGCLRKKGNGLRHGYAGERKPRIYTIWQSMRQRCNDPSATGYKYYGGRGIAVCEAWNSFEVFLQDMHASYLEHVELFGEKNTTIERQNNGGNYDPDNCIWATYKQQANNKRRREHIHSN